MILTLLNPHTVEAALVRRPGSVQVVTLPPNGAGEAWERVAQMAQKARVPVRVGAPSQGDRRRRGPKQGREGGASAEVLECPDVTLDRLLKGAAQRENGRSLWLALDRIQDPRNLGAAFRAAAFFGVSGVLLTRDQSAPLTAVAHDTSSGGTEHVPFCWAANLAQDLKLVKDAGVWVLGAAEDARTEVHQVARDRPWMLVVGNEEQGLRRLTRERCDDVCRVTSHGQVSSLNAATASAVLLSALRRPG